LLLIVHEFPIFLIIGYFEKIILGRASYDVIELVTHITVNLSKLTDVTHGLEPSWKR